MSVSPAKRGTHAMLPISRYASKRFSRHVPWVLCLLVASLFTVVMVQASLRKGKLLMPPTYDDVTYCIDGIWQLQAFYDGGAAGLMKSLVASPPHSPSSTMLAAGSYLIFGIHDWAPYAGNVIVVFCYLLFAASLVRKAPPLYRAAAWLFFATVPVVTNAVNEFKPDIFCGLATAAAVLVIARNIAFGATGRSLAAGGALLAGALLIKPTFTPATILFCAISAGLAAVARFGSGRRFSLPAAGRSVAIQFGIGIALVLPYFLLVWRRLYGYIIANAFGTWAPLWITKRTALENALYFVTGPGGGFMFGKHLLAIAVVLACAAVASAGLAQRARILFHAYFAAMCFAAYLLPTRMEVKNPFSGVQFTFLLIFWALASFSHLGKKAVRHPAPGHKVLGAVALAAFAIAPLGLRFPIGGYGADAILRNRLVERHHRFLREKILERDRSRDAGPLVVTASTAGPFYNSWVFEYLLLKDGITNFRFNDLRREGRIEAFRRAFAASDVVLANEPNGEEAYDWLPSGKIQRQTLQLVRGMSDFFLASSATTPAGCGYYAFERVEGFSGNIQFLAGFGDPEGPYPQWNLPLGRWGLGPSSTLHISPAGAGPARLVLSGISWEPKQSMRIRSGGVEIARHEFTGPGQFEAMVVPLDLPAGGADVEIAYASWTSRGGADKRPRAVLFRSIRVISRELE